MVKTLQSWRAPLLILAIAILAGAGYLLFRPRYDTPGKLVSLLPKSDSVVFYADVGTLRTSGVLRRIEGAKSSQEVDYQRFVSDTGFSYERDLDALGVAVLPNQIFAVLRGRFDWPRLSRSAVQQGGSCRNSYCQSPTGKPGRWLSFFPIRSNLMGLAISSDPSAAYTLMPRPGAPLAETPFYPAWAQIPKRVLDNPAAMPPVLQVFARALSSASQVTFGLNRQPDGADKQEFVIELLAQCDSEAEAGAVRDHLSQLTRMFGSAARQNGQQDEGGLGALLTSGAFEVNRRQVNGTWLLPDAFIDSLLR